MFSRSHPAYGSQSAGTCVGFLKKLPPQRPGGYFFQRVAIRSCACCSAVSRLAVSRSWSVARSTHQSGFFLKMLSRYPNAHSRAGSRRVVPLSSQNSTATIRSQISLPNAPALPRTAPPTVPGIPARLARSDHPRDAASRIRCWRFFPASTVTISSCQSVFSAEILNTLPRNPASAQTRFEPLPSTRRGSRSAIVSAQISGSATRSLTVTSSSASPPTPKYVWALSGAFFTTSIIVGSLP